MLAGLPDQRIAVRRFCHATGGATAIEYGLIAAGIGAVIVGVLAFLGPGLVTVFQNIVNAFGG